MARRAARATHRRRRRFWPSFARRTAVSPDPSKQIHFEPLEPRILLSADLGVDNVMLVPSSDADELFPGDIENNCYVFADDWGSDSVSEDAFTSEDILDFSAVTSDLTFTITEDGEVTVTDDADPTNTVTANGIEWLVGGQSENTYLYQGAGHLEGGIAGGGTILGDGSDNLFSITTDNDSAEVWVVDGAGGSDQLAVDAAGQTFAFGTATEFILGDVPALQDSIQHLNTTTSTVSNSAVSTADESNLAEGLEEFAALGESLRDFEALAQIIPFSDAALGDYANLFAILDQLASDFDAEEFANSDDIASYLTDSWAPVIPADAGDNVTDGPIAIDPARTVSSLVDAQTGSLEVAFAFASSRSNTLDIGGSAEFRDEFIELEDLQLALETSVAFDLIFGTDSTGAFYLSVPGLTASVAASLTGIGLGARIGFLDVQVPDGSVDLDGEVQLDINGGGSMTTSELDAAAGDDTALEALVDIGSASGELALEFDYLVGGGFAAGAGPLAGTLTFSSADYFADAPSISLPLDAEDFRLMTANELIGFLDQLARSLSGVAQGQLLDLEIPLLDGTTVGDALPFGEAFVEQVLNALYDFNGLVGSFASVSADELMLVVDGVNTPVTLPAGSYADLQEFLDALNAVTLPLGVEAVSESGTTDRISFIPLAGIADSVRLPMLDASALSVGSGYGYGPEIAGFRTAQDLAGELTRAIGGGVTIEAEYEAGELRFDIVFDYDVLLASLPLDFSVDMGDFGGLNTSTTLDLEAALDIAFTFGVVIGDTPELVIAAPIFVPDAGAFGSLSDEATFTITVLPTSDDADIASLDPPFSITVNVGPWAPVPASSETLSSVVQDAIDLALIEADRNQRADARLGFDAFQILAAGVATTAVDTLPRDGQVSSGLRVGVLSGGVWSFDTLTEADDSTGTNGETVGIDGRDELVEDLQALLDGMAAGVLVGRDGGRLTLTNTGVTDIEVRFFISEVVAEDSGSRISLTAPPTRVTEPRDPGDPEEPDRIIDRRLEITIGGATAQDRLDNPAYSELGLLSSPVRFDGVLGEDVNLTLRINDRDYEISIDAAASSGYTSIGELIDHINDSLTAINLQLIVDGLTANADGDVLEAALLAEGGNRVVFRAVDGSGVTSMSVPVTGLSDSAVTEFGFDQDDEQSVKTSAASLFLEQTDDTTMFRGALSLGTEDIVGSAQFGFLEVNLRDSLGEIQAEAGFNLQNPADAESRIPLADLLDAVGRGRVFFNSGDLLGLTTGASAAFGEPLVAGGSLPVDGQLGSSARFVLTVTDVNELDQPRSYNISVRESDTEANTGTADLVADVQSALDRAGLTGLVIAGQVAGNLTLTPGNGDLALSLPHSLFAEPYARGSLDVNLIVQPSVGGADPVAPANLSLALEIDDWLRFAPTLDDADSPHGLNINFSGLDVGFFDTLTNIDAGDVVDALREAVDFLRALFEGNDGGADDEALLPALDIRLPLINLDLGGLLDIADEFSRIVDSLAVNPDLGFDAIEALLRDLLGLDVDNPLVDLDLDLGGDGIVLRIDLAFETGVDLNRPFDLDLADLAELAGGVPELEGVLSLVGVNSSGDLDVYADALLQLGVGVALGANGGSDDEAEGTAAGVEALGFKNGDDDEGFPAVVTARVEPSADRLQEQNIVFLIRLNDDEPIRIEVTPSAETEDQAEVDEDTEIGDEGGQLSIDRFPEIPGLDPNPAELRFTLRSGETVDVDLGDADDVAGIVEAISDASDDLEARFEEGRFIITDSSDRPAGTGGDSQTGNPVFLRADGDASKQPPAGTTSDALHFSMRVGTDSLRFDVHVSELTYDAGLSADAREAAWLAHIESSIRTAMVEAGLMAADEPLRVHASYINNLTFDANRTLTIWPDIAPEGATFSVEPLNLSLAVLDLGLLGALVVDSDPDQTTLIGFELRANVSIDQLLEDINEALAGTDLAGLVQAEEGAGGVIQFTTVGGTDPQYLSVENLPEEPGFIRPFLYDGQDATGLFLSAGVLGSNLEFTAQVGPFGFYVIDGSASLTTGLDIFVIDADGDGRHYFDQGFATEDFTHETRGDAHASLPLFFPTESSPVGDTPLVIDVDLIQFFAAKDPSVPDPATPSVTISAPDLTAFPTPTLIGMLSNPEYVVDGLDALLGQLQSALDAEVLSVNLPLVGDQLQDAGQFIADFREDVLSYISAKLREGGLNPVTIVHEALFNVFGGADDGDPLALEVLGFASGVEGFGVLTGLAAPEFDEDGRLVREARFLITVGDEDPVLIVVDPTDEDVATGLDGLVAAINVSLAARGVDRVEASATGNAVRFSAPGQRLLLETAHAVPLDLFGLRVGALGLLEDANQDFLIDIDDVQVSGFGLFDEYGQFDLMLGNSYVYAQPLDFDLGLPALGLALDADVEVYLDWQLDFAFGIDQTVGFYFATDAHPNAPEGPLDLGPELTIRGGAELVGEDTASLLGYENRDSDGSRAISDALSQADIDALNIRGAGGDALKFRVTLNDGLEGADGALIERTYLLTISSATLVDIENVAELADALNAAIGALNQDIMDANAGSADPLPLLEAVAGVFVDERGNERLELIATDGDTMTIRGDVASAEGRLGFLVVEAADQGVAGIDLAFTVDLLDPGTTQDGKLSFSEMIAGSTTTDSLVAATFDGRAVLDLDVGVNLSLLGLDGAFLPNIGLDLNVDWDFANVDTQTDSSEFGGRPDVSFTNIQLDLGSFISDFAGPFLGDLGEVLEPLDFLLDPNDGLLYLRLPVISDLMGQTINIRRLAELFDTEDRISPFLDAVEEIYFFIGLVTDAAANAEMDFDGDGAPDGIVLNFGDLEFPDLRGLGDLSGFSLGGAGDSGSIQQTGERTSVDDLDDENPDGTPNKTKAFSSNLTSPGRGSFDFPILTDPSNVLNLLIGNTADVTLVTYDLPPFGFEFDYLQRFPIYPPLFATLRGYFAATIDLAFGYDALGLSQFSYTNNALDLLNGFFIADTDLDTGIDIPELTFTGGVLAGASLDVAVASAGVEGGIEVNVYFDLSDPNMDSRVRLGELEANLLLNNYNPLAIFDVSGQMDALLRAYVEVLFGLWSEEFELARVELVNFDGGLFEFDRPPALAQQDSSGVLTLNVGVNSASRFHGDLRDSGETIYATGDENELILRSSINGLEQHYYGVDRIVAYAGDGNDYIDLSQVSGVEVELYGGSGNDVLIGGAGINYISGGEGDDRISGGGSADELDGGAGNDELIGAGGADQLIGGAGADTLDGGAGPDRLDGGLGDDLLDGGGGINTYAFASNWGRDRVVDLDALDPEAPFEVAGGDDLWDFSAVRSDITFTLGLAGAAAPVTSAESLGNTVRQAGYGMAKILSGRGADLFEIWMTGSQEIRLDGGAGSDIYLSHASELPQITAVKDTGNFWDQDRLIVEGSNAGDMVLVSDQQVVSNGQPVSYRSDAPDAEDQAAFEVLGFDAAVFAAELVSELDDGELAQRARINLSVGGEPAALVVVDPGDVEGEQTLRDLAAALNFSLEIADLDGLVEAVVVGQGAAEELRLVSLTGALLSAEAVITGPGLEVLDVFGRDGDDQFAITSTPDFMAVSIGAGEGNDDVVVGPLLAAIKGGPFSGPLTINGDEGLNRLALSDSGSVLDGQGQLTRDRLTGFGIGVAIDFFNFDELTVLLGQGSDVLEVTGSNEGTTLIAGGAGADVIDVRSASGTLTVLGGDQADRITLEATDAGSLVTVAGDEGDDTLNVRTMRGDVAVLGGSGDDSIAVGSEAGLDVAGTLNGINGQLDIHGGTGDDRLRLDDSSDGDQRLASSAALSERAESGRLGGDAVFLLSVDGEPAVEIRVAADVGVLESEAIIDAALTDTGVLSRDARFILELEGEETQILLERDTSNASVADLEADLAAALVFHNIASERVAVSIRQVEGGSVVVFESLQGETLELLLDDDPGAAELGLVDGQQAQFANSVYQDLIADVNTALVDAGLGGRVEAVALASSMEGGMERHTLALELIAGSSLLVDQVNDDAAEDLGLSDEQFLQPDNDGTLSLIDEAGVQRAQLIGLGMGSTGNGLPGVLYDGAETVEILLGAGDDRFNVQGTLAGTTWLDAADGDDSVNVASEAGATDPDGRPLGVLAHVLGALNIDAGSGANALSISDSSNASDTTAILSAGMLRGLSPGEIRFDAAAGFQQGINLWLGSGVDLLQVQGARPLDATTVHLGAGDDQLSAIDQTPSVDGALVIFGEQGDDRIDASGWQSAVAATGDDGRVAFERDSAGNTSVTRIEAMDSSTPGDDVLIGGDGADRLIGGAGNDLLDGRGGADVLIGDMGVVTSQAGLLIEVSTQESNVAGTDDLLGGEGDDLLLGGSGSDRLQGEAGNDLLFGDSASIDYENGDLAFATVIDPFVGDDDVLAGGRIGSEAEDGGDSNDFLIGGAGSDTLYGTLAEDLLIGDFGSVLYDGPEIEAVQVLGQRPLDLPASTLFELYNGPLAERPHGPQLESPSVSGPEPVVVSVAAVSTHTAQATLLTSRDGESGATITGAIVFGSDSDRVPEDSLADLRAIAELVRQNPAVVLSITGHTDDQGDVDYNLQLSNRRAEHVKSILIELGVSADQIRSRAAGEADPVLGDDGQPDRTQSRRVDIELLPLVESASEAAAMLGFTAWQRVSGRPVERGLIDWSRDPMATGQTDRGFLKIEQV